MARTLLVIAATVGLVGAAASSAWAQGEPAQMPPSERPVEAQRHLPNRPLLIFGAATIVASYTPAVVVAATSGREGDQYLYIPVAGPWVDLGVRGGCGPVTCGREAVYKTLIVATGVAHLVGVSAALASFFVEEPGGASATSAKPAVVPMQIGVGGYGLGMAGAF